MRSLPLEEIAILLTGVAVMVWAMWATAEMVL